MNSILRTFCLRCHHGIHLETSNDKSEIREWRAAEHVKAKVEIWVSYCHNCESSETVTSEFSERHKEGRRTPVDMLEGAWEGHREPPNGERDKDGPSRDSEKRRFREHGIISNVKCYRKKSINKTYTGSQEKSPGVANPSSLVTKK